MSITETSSTEILATEYGAGLVSAGRIEGSSVYNQLGGYIGHIENVLLDHASGRVAYVLVSCGGFLGVGARYHPLPWCLLARRADQDGYELRLTSEQLAAAPCLTLRQLGEDDRLWRDNTYSYYKVQPYWA